MPQSTINQRLKFLLDFHQISARTLSRELGVPDTNTQNYVGPKQAEPGAHYLEKLILHFPQVDAYWLLTGDHEPFLEVEGETADLPSSKTLYQAQQKNTGNVIGTNNGTATVNHHLADCEKDLRAAQREIELLSNQLEVQTKYIRLLEANNAK